MSNYFGLVCGYPSRDDLQTARSLADDLVGNCGNYNRSSTKNSPFHRYGKLSSSFRSQLTATELKKMLHGGSSGGVVAGQHHRPRSLASSENDVYQKSATQDQTPTNGKTGDSNKKTQVIDWSASFDVLLGDKYGVHAFAEFLRKEFSGENIYFWTACERYKQLQCANDRFREAQKIFERHLENGAPEPVNVDSHATSKTRGQLKLANVDLFDASQKQIYNLMKFDSYARFIKSDIYKQCLDCEMKKLPPPYPENRILDPALTTTNSVGMHSHSPTVSPVKLKKSLSNAEDRRRKSLLPWHRKTRTKSKDRNEEKKDTNGHHNSNSIYSSRSSLSSFDAVLEASDTNQRTQLCRVVLPNGATTIVQTRSTETIRELVVRLLEKRGLSYTCFEVFIGESNKPCDLEGMSTKIAGKQVHIEQRVTFKLDLPNKKVISVKSKPEKVLEDVLRPILHKYHYSLNKVHVSLKHQSSHDKSPEQPLTKCMVTEIDGRRLIIEDGSVVESHTKSTLHEITNRVFSDILPEHPSDGGESAKRLADYSNCRFVGQQMTDACLPETPRAIEEDQKRSVIAKWTTGTHLQSPTHVAHVDSHLAMRSDGDQHRPVNVDISALPKGDRPVPAPRHSVTRSSKSSMNNSKDSGILSNHGDNSVNSNADGTELSKDNELDHVKSPPPPLPPKPKLLPIRGPNWGGNPAGPKNIYLDQPTSSFV